MRGVDARARGTVTLGQGARSGRVRRGKVAGLRASRGDARAARVWQLCRVHRQAVRLLAADDPGEAAGGRGAGGAAENVGGVGIGRVELVGGEIGRASCREKVRMGEKSERRRKKKTVQESV